MGHVEEVKKKNKLLAMIIRNDYSCEGGDLLAHSQISFYHSPLHMVPVLPLPFQHLLIPENHVHQKPVK